MAQNKQLFDSFYNYCKNETNQTLADFETEWEKMADKTKAEAKQSFENIMKDTKMQELFNKMTKQQQEATANFLIQTLTYAYMEKNTTGTTKVLEKLKEYNKNGK